MRGPGIYERACLRRAAFKLCREVRSADNSYLEPEAPSGARAGTGGQDPNTVNFQNLHKKVVVYRAPRCEHERTQLECFAKRLPMYEVKFTVGGIGRLLPVATSLLGLGLFVIWTEIGRASCRERV